MSSPPPDPRSNSVESPRQQAAASPSWLAHGWGRLLALQTDDQRSAAAILLFVAFIMGGWCLWQATTTPGLIELERTELSTSKLVVNVNTADEAELMLLPEIGKTTAAKIVEERLANGPFRDAAEFGKRIRGIGPKTLPKVAPFLEGWTEEPQPK